MTNKGAGLKQIIVLDGSAPGTGSSVYSAKQSVTVTTNAHTVITDIGELLFMPTGSTYFVEFQDPLNTWTTLIPASATSAHQFFSDGQNLRFSSNDTSTTRTGTYYIVQ
jgi:hypothetical protein